MSPKGRRQKSRHFYDGDLHGVASASPVQEVTEAYLLEGRGQRPPIIQWKACEGHTGEQATV